MAALLADNLPVPPPNEALLALGIEGSANKVGVGQVVREEGGHCNPSSWSLRLQDPTARINQRSNRL